MITLNILDIVTLIKSNEFSIIGIDGVDGSGKSTLAYNLSKELDCTWISLDDFIEENKGGYVPFINTYELLKKLEEIRGLAIIEGCCLLLACKKISINLDVMIYTRRLSFFGYWIDAKNYDISEEIEDFIRRKNDECTKFNIADSLLSQKPVYESNNGISGLEEELIRYHYEFRPQEKANIIYEWYLKVGSNSQV
jgi:hypothetical protein